MPLFLAHFERAAPCLLLTSPPDSVFRHGVALQINSRRPSWVHLVVVDFLHGGGFSDICHLARAHAAPVRGAEGAGDDGPDRIGKFAGDEIRFLGLGFFASAELNEIAVCAGSGY